MSAALELAEQGYKVIVLEAERVGWGASGRNGGQIINGYSRSLAVVEQRHGADIARALGQMALEGGSIIRDRVERYGTKCDLRAGSFVAALTTRQVGHLRDEQAVWAKHGHTDVKMIDRAGLSRFVASDRYVGGLFDPEGGHLHPLNFVLGEAAAFEQLGGTIHEGSRVCDVRPGNRPTVSTANGQVTARYVLLAGNAYLGDAVPELSRRVMPVSSQIVATQPLGDRIHALLPADACVEDASYILDYFRRTADDRLLYGGGLIYGGTDPASIEGRVRPGLETTFPELKGVRIDYAWSGNFALTMSRFPQIGRFGPGVLFAHGDSGHGVSTTQLLGRLMGEAVAGQLERFDIWEGLPYWAFPGGQRFRVPMAVLGATYYQIRDRLGI